MTYNMVLIPEPLLEDFLTIHKHSLENCKIIISECFQGVTVSSISYTLWLSRISG